MSSTDKQPQGIQGDKENSRDYGAFQNTLYRSESDFRQHRNMLNSSSGSASSTAPPRYDRPKQTRGTCPENNEARSIRLHSGWCWREGYNGCESISLPAVEAGPADAAYVCLKLAI